ncbi:MAG TPA: hypothetical protein VIQ80_03180 [Candidatus Saccharimonadales bacterium]
MKRHSPHSIKHEGRLTYGAVPLEPWTAVEERRGIFGRRQSETYMAASVLRICTGINKALDAAVRQYDWVQSPELEAQLRDIIETSLYDSQSRRVELNPGSLERGDVNVDDPRYEKAKNGTASPAELLTLLIDYPKLNSVELAKLSHPLDFAASEGMDSDVMFTLARLGFEFIDEPGRHRIKAMQPEIPAMTVQRKQTVAELEVAEGLLQVVQNRTFLVRGDEEACAENDRHLDRLILNPERRGEVYEKIEQWYPYARQLPVGHERARKWLQPLSSSYYAKIVPLPEPSMLEA